MEQEALSVTQVAKMLGISRTFAYAAVNDGTIPSFRLGKRVLVPKAALDEMLQVGSKRRIVATAGVSEKRG